MSILPFGIWCKGPLYPCNYERSLTNQIQYITSRQRQDHGTPRLVEVEVEVEVVVAATAGVLVVVVVVVVVVVLVVVAALILSSLTHLLGVSVEGSPPQHDSQISHPTKTPQN